MTPGPAPAGDLLWLWQAVVSGVTIATILGALDWVRSKWREHIQVRQLRETIGSCYALMRLSLLPDTSESYNQPDLQNKRLREVYDEHARELLQLRDHATPDLHYKKATDIRRVMAAMASRFAAAGPIDFGGQHPRWALYDKEFFDWCRKLEWLGLDLDSISEKITRLDLKDIAMGSRRVIFLQENPERPSTSKVILQPSVDPIRDPYNVPEVRTAVRQVQVVPAI